MRGKDFDALMRKHEWFHQMFVPEGMRIIIRVDGRGFTSLTRDLGLQKPFDLKFSRWMTDTAECLLSEFEAEYAYTESDEISILLPAGFDMFSREVEKLVSVSAGEASAIFTHVSDVIGSFDSRLCIFNDLYGALDYFVWRQADAARCALNGWVYWTLRNNGGMTRRGASKMMHGKSREWKHNLLHNHGINFNNLPDWQRRGIGVYYESYIKDGWNPITQEVEQATRRRVKTNRHLSMKDSYREFLHELLT